MTQFRDDNTDGFTSAELALLNRVFDRLQNWFPGTDESNIADAINNSWQTGMTEDELYRASAKKLA